jgi:hypothetical protein
VITVRLNTNAGRRIAFGGAEGLVVTRGTISKGRNLLGQLIPKQVTRSLGAFGHGRGALEPTSADQAHETRHAPGGWMRASERARTRLLCDLERETTKLFRGAWLR